MNSTPRLEPLASEKRGALGRTPCREQPCLLESECGGDGDGVVRVDELVGTQGRLRGAVLVVAEVALYGMTLDAARAFMESIAAKNAALMLGNESPGALIEVEAPMAIGVPLGLAAPALPPEMPRVR